MIKYTDKCVLWIDADDYDQAWDAYRDNPIPIPDIRAVVINAEIAHLLRGEAMEAFFKEHKSALTKIIEETQERQYVHVLPYSVQTQKFQCLLSSPIRMWMFDKDENTTPENAGWNCCESLLQREIDDDESVIGVLRHEEGRNTHFFFLLVVAEEFKSENTVWISRSKIDDWKWDDYAKMMIYNEDVRDITNTHSPYTKLVNEMAG